MLYVLSSLDNAYQQCVSQLKQLISATLLKDIMCRISMCCAPLWIETERPSVYCIMSFYHVILFYSWKIKLAPFRYESRRVNVVTLWFYENSLISIAYYLCNIKSDKPELIMKFMEYEVIMLIITKYVPLRHVMFLADNKSRNCEMIWIWWKP